MVLTQFGFVLELGERAKIEYKFVPIRPKDDNKKQPENKNSNKATLETIPEEDEPKDVPTHSTFELNCF